MIAEKFEKMSRALKYPSMDKNRVRKIEDLSGKQNRMDAFEKYRNEIRLERMEKYQKEQSRIYQEFKLALFKEYGFENHPKREKMFSMAWERGHAEGLNSVEQEFIELTELMED